MNISDLQYIESVDASEVVGAGKKGKKWRKPKGYVKKTSADASLSLDVEALGDIVDTDVDATVFADSTPTFSISQVTVDATASAKSYTYYKHH